jgi:LPXTG-motif cell wall-anchored protein
MDWFERLTGLDPDKGTGSFEAMLAAVIGVAIIAAASYILSRRKASTTTR